jgi:putative Mg2+ transporter-C (MgtC) family protein
MWLPKAGVLVLLAVAEETRLRHSFDPRSGFEKLAELLCSIPAVNDAGERICNRPHQTIEDATRKVNRMPLTLGWTEIAIRLTLSIVAGALTGLDRGEHNRPAGLRTTLLGTGGKTPDSFSVLDLMRLPLGILTGMGFIGAGAILKRDGSVFGVTTAATLWFVTVIGLCFGGGQLLLGISGTVLALLVVSALRWFDHRMKQDKHATLTLITDENELSKEEIYVAVQRAGFKIGASCASYANRPRETELESKLQWRARSQSADEPAFVRELAHNPHILKIQWKLV